MKKFLPILVVVFMSLAFTSCKTKEEKAAEDNIDKMNEVLEQQVDLQERVDKGILTEEEAEDLSNEISRKYIEEINTDPPTGLPAWAKELKLSDPEGLTLDPVMSTQTSVNGPEGFDSIHLIYDGDFDASVAEAERIAEEAGIPKSEELEQAKALARQFATSEEDLELLKGVTFLNYDSMNFDDAEFWITIDVDSEGTLSIDAANVKQMQKAETRINQ